MRHFLLLLTSLFLLATACTKEDDGPADPLDELPPATQVGANTFGCLINGEPWYNRGGSFNRPDLKAGYAETLFGPHLSITAYAHNPSIADRKDRLLILYRNPTVSNFGADERWTEPFEFTYDDYVFYRLDTLSPVRLSLTRFDLQAQIASGTFEFTAINDELMDTLVVTEGRFDVEFIR